LPNVRIVGLTKTFRDIQALEDVSLEVRDREYISVIGPSGCGKSTLLRCVAGILNHDSGQVFIGDREVSDLPPEQRQLGYMFQEIALFPHMSTSQNVGYGPRVRGRSVQASREFIGQVMEMVRLAADGSVYPAELSGGARQKTALARAIAAEPQLMLLDEPLGALDAYVRATLRYELRRLVKELGLTAIHVTHDQEEAMSISDRLVIMKAGRIVEVGTPLQLYLSPKRIFTANFLGEANFLKGNVVECESNQTTVSVNDWKVTFLGNGFTQGERVVLAVRPEWVMLSSSAGEANEEWKGVVREQVLLGDVIRTEVQLDNEMQIVAHAPNMGLGRGIRVGEAVRIDFSAGSVLAYRQPVDGLDAELALE